MFGNDKKTRSAYGVRTPSLQRTSRFNIRSNTDIEQYTRTSRVIETTRRRVTLYQSDGILYDRAHRTDAYSQNNIEKVPVEKNPFLTHKQLNDHKGRVLEAERADLLRIKRAIFTDELKSVKKNPLGKIFTQRLEGVVQQPRNCVLPLLDPGVRYDRFDVERHTISPAMFNAVLEFMRDQGAFKLLSSYDGPSCVKLIMDSPSPEETKSIAEAIKEGGDRILSQYGNRVYFCPNRIITEGDSSPLKKTDTIRIEEMYSPAYDGGILKKKAGVYTMSNWKKTDIFEDVKAEKQKDLLVGGQVRHADQEYTVSIRFYATEEYYDKKTGRKHVPETYFPSDCESILSKPKIFVQIYGPHLNGNGGIRRVTGGDTPFVSEADGNHTDDVLVGDSMFHDNMHRLTEAGYLDARDARLRNQIRQENERRRTLERQIRRTPQEEEELAELRTAHQRRQEALDFEREEALRAERMEHISNTSGKRSGGK